MKLFKVRTSLEGLPGARHRRGTDWVERLLDDALSIKKIILKNVNCQSTQITALIGHLNYFNSTLKQGVSPKKIPGWFERDGKLSFERNRACMAWIASEVHCFKSHIEKHGKRHSTPYFRRQHGDVPPPAVASQQSRTYLIPFLTVSLG